MTQMNTSIEISHFIFPRFPLKTLDSIWPSFYNNFIIRKLKFVKILCFSEVGILLNKAKNNFYKDLQIITSPPNFWRSFILFSSYVKKILIFSPTNCKNLFHYFFFSISSSKIQNFLLYCIVIHLLSQPTSQLFEVILR